MLDAASLRELLVKKMVWPAARREAVARLRAVLDLSERRACTIVSADRTMIRYRSLRPADSALRDRSGTLANERRRFGYRRLCGQAHRNGRSAAQPRPAPPIGHCSTCARPRTLRSDSRRRWMKVQRQVSPNRSRSRRKTRRQPDLWHRCAGSRNQDSRPSPPPTRTRTVMDVREDLMRLTILIRTFAITRPLADQLPFPGIFIPFWWSISWRRCPTS